MNSVPVITLDGPSGSGKGTVAAELAYRLDFNLLDSGALYRLLALAARRDSLALDATPALVELAHRLQVAFLRQASGKVSIQLDATSVDNKLRTEQCARDASKLAAISAVREALLARQRAFCQPPGLVADGRDMGTVVFPCAELKIFLTASAEVRAERRCKQLKEQGFDVSLRTLLSDIQERDRRDQTRTVAPLVPAPEAVIIDSSQLSIQSVVEQAMALVQRYLPQRASTDRASH